VNERERQVTREIASLQGRVDQLAAACAASDLVLSALATEVEAALAVPDQPQAARLARKLELMRHRRSTVANEIGTLQELIDVRRRLGGSSVPGYQ
jgi:hypothetical protein